MNRFPRLPAILLLLAFAFGGTGRADNESEPYPDTITTRVGITYTDVQIREITADAIVFFHSRGAARILLRNLTPELQQIFGYDPEAAAIAEREEAERQARIRRRLIVEREAFYAAERERLRKMEEARLRREEAAARLLLAQASRPARYDRTAYAPFYSSLSEPARPLYTRSRYRSYRPSSYHQSHDSSCDAPQTIFIASQRPSSPSRPQPSPVRVQQGAKIATPAPYRGARR